MKEIDPLENMFVRVRPVAPADFTENVLARVARDLRQRKRRNLVVAFVGVTMGIALFLAGAPFKTQRPKTQSHANDRGVASPLDMPASTTLAAKTDGVIPTRPNLPHEGDDTLPIDDPNWQAAWGAANSLTAPSRGSQAPEVTLVLFLDYQCPYCARFEQTLTELLALYQNKLQIVVRQFPLPFHEHSELAAKAALAAYEQGHFWEMHALLLAQKEGLLGAALERYAVSAGLDLDLFRASLRDGRSKEALAADANFAKDLAITGTPTSIIVNRRHLGRVDGAQDLKTLADMVDRALAQQ